MNMTQNNRDKQICGEIVTRIALLAKLRLTPDESEMYRSDFSALLELFHQLDELDISSTENVDISLMNAEDCREDIPGEGLSTEGISRATPHFNKNSTFFDVPQFIDHE